MKATVGRMVQVKLAGTVFPAVVAGTVETETQEDGDVVLSSESHVHLVVFAGRSVTVGREGGFQGGGDPSGYAVAC